MRRARAASAILLLSAAAFADPAVDPDEDTDQRQAINNRIIRAREVRLQREHEERLKDEAIQREYLRQRDLAASTLKGTGAVPSAVKKTPAKKPPAKPVLPPDALKFQGRAEYAFRNAKAPADFAAAAREWENALIHAPTNANDHYNAGVAWEKAEDPVRARDAFLRYLELAPNAPDAADVSKRVAGLAMAAEKPPAPPGPDFTGRWNAISLGGRTINDYFVIEWKDQAWFARHFSGTASKSTIAGRRILIENQTDMVTYHWDLLLSPDGKTLEGLYETTQTPQQVEAMKRGGYLTLKLEYIPVTLKKS